MRNMHKIPHGILILEDDKALAEALIGSLSARLKLTEAGLTIQHAENLADARAIDLSAVRALILDGELPDGTAVDFLQTMENQIFGKTVVLSSGSFAVEQEVLRRWPGVVSLPKPYRLDTLAAFLRL